MKKLLILLFLANVTIFAQDKFEVKKASKTYNVRVEVEKCDNQYCQGKTRFSLVRKNQPNAFQTIEFKDLTFSLNELTNTPIYHQSYLLFGDYNFDSAEDLAILDGNHGLYRSKSYQIYLFSPRSKKFVHNRTLTELAQNNSYGMFTVDNKKRVLRFWVKADCCMFYTTEYRIINNRPQKILEIEEDRTSGDIARITTRRLVKGKWKTSIKYEKLSN